MLFLFSETISPLVHYPINQTLWFQNKIIETQALLSPVHSKLLTKIEQHYRQV